MLPTRFYMVCSLEHFKCIIDHFFKTTKCLLTDIMPGTLLKKQPCYRRVKRCRAYKYRQVLQFIILSYFLQALKSVFPGHIQTKKKGIGQPFSIMNRLDICRHPRFHQGFFKKSAIIFVIISKKKAQHIHSTQNTPNTLKSKVHIVHLKLFNGVYRSRLHGQRTRS